MTVSSSLGQRIAFVGVVLVLTTACESRSETLLEPGEASLGRGGNQLVWQANAPMPMPREGTCQGAVGNRIYVTHGYGPPTGDSNTNQIYDVARNAWSMGTPATVRRSEGVGWPHAGRLYCIGGRGFDPLGPSFGVLNSNEIYITSQDVWIRGAPMPTPRAAFALTEVGGKLYAIGGRNGSAPRSGAPLNNNEVYDPAHDTWTVATPMPTPRMDVVSTTHNGKIYVVGGYNQVLCGGACNRLEIYDPATDTWTVGAPMPTPRSSLTVAVFGNTLYAIAGATNNFRLTGINEAYDIDKGTWAEAPRKPTPTAETFAVRHGDEIFIIGGGYFGVGFSPVPGAVNESFSPQPHGNPS